MTYLPLPPLGQTTKTSSLPVTVASDQTVYVPLLEEALPTVSSSTAIFANAPSGTKSISICVRTKAIGLTFDGTTVPTASGGAVVVGLDIPIGGPYTLELNRTQALLVRAIESGATATGYIVYWGV